MIFSSHSPWQFGTKLLGMLSVWMLVMVSLVPAASASANDEAAFIASVNQTRAAKGLPALKTDVQLTNLARGWAGAMRDGTCGSGNFICHASPISAGVTHPWEKLGENVGTGPDVAAVMSAFIASPGHYANIIDPEFTHIGVGVVWEDGRMYTTHRFMKLQGTPAPTTTTTTTAAPTTTTTTTAPPASTTTSAPSNTQAPTTTTAPPVTTSPENDGGSSNQQPAGPTSPANNTTEAGDPPSTPESVRQSEAVLEERVTVLINAFTVVSS